MLDVGGLVINENSNLSSLIGLDAVLTVDEDILIIDNPVLNNLCDLQILMQNGFSGAYSVEGNAYNPTQQNIIDGNCSL